MVRTAEEASVGAGEDRAAGRRVQAARRPGENELPVLDEAPAVVRAGLPAVPELLWAKREPRLGKHLESPIGVLHHVHRAAGLTAQAVPRAPTVRRGRVLPD